MKKLILKGRYYRTIPIDSPGYEFEILELDPEKTAFVELHCWDIGCPGGPPLDNNFKVYMGSCQEVADETYRIMKSYIRPAMDGARSVGIPVFHVQDTTIARKYPQYVKEPIKENVIFSPPPVSEQQIEILERAHGRDYHNRSPLKDMDIPQIVAPKDEEPVVSETNQLDKILRERGILNIIYTGFATDLCILHAPGGSGPMLSLGYNCFLIREATLGSEFADTFDERLATRWGLRFFETQRGHTIGFEDFISSCERIRGKN
jgi:nicotinamidase-related amidase